MGLLRRPMTRAALCICIKIAQQSAQMIDSATCPSLPLLFDWYEDHTQLGEYLILYILLSLFGYPAVGPLTILQMQQA